MLLIRITKGRDARDLLTVVRADGTQTWSRVQPGIPLHDMAHYVVESTLGLANGFYGLVAQGWDIPAFSEPRATRNLPAEAGWVEHAVNLLMIDVFNSRFATVEEFNATLAAGVAGYRRDLTAEELETLRARLLALRDEWKAVAPGQALEFRLDRTG